MHTLVVLAHPDRRSFNAHLAEQTRQTLLKKGQEVTVLDLYAEDFDPREGSWHYPNRADDDRFDAMQEQRHHWRVGQLPVVVERHVHLLLRSDALVLQFPFWWFGAPAMLKGWMDRVFVYGGLYRSGMRYETGSMRGKKALIVSTSGSSEQACGPNGREGDMRMMLWPIMNSLHYIGFEVLQPYLIHGIRGGLASDEVQVERAQRVLDYQAKLANWEAWPLVQFNRNDDFTDQLTLKPNAPVYSPFVRHSEYCGEWPGLM